MIFDYKMAPKGLAARHVVAFPVVTAVSQTALLAGAHTPGVRYQVTKVTVFAATVTATITVDVQIAGVSVLTGAITPVAATEVAGVLATSQATLRAPAATSQLQVKYTSNGSGAATGLVVHVQLRPYPSFGEIA